MKDLSEADVILACTPYDSSVKLFKNTRDSVNQTKYASIIGSLRYVADCTRLDIAYAVGLLCRFTSRPSLEHWNAIERVMRYLKKTQNLGLHYNKFPTVLKEMIALATTREEASLLRSLLSEIPTWEGPILVILIHCDSTAVIANVQNRYYNGKRL
ncbi:pentatricopeptide repeat-containing protein [Cucumis melo var. makuwa]|uniref:Pentatricopeptide repeat-containing protein n=1 Tax=Cucumis melo var. makuwa TaxID=1194695 RepID=A0A5D3E403_CUCMM|nr:pentatricopeptide repeat-containing protein [Cucumis melo var. makuwa]